MKAEGKNSMKNKPKRGNMAGKKKRPKVNKGSLGRAIKYLTRYKKEAFLAYGALILATGAQLLVPQMVQNIMDAMVDGFVASKVLDIPASFQSIALDKLGLTLAEVQANSDGAMNAIITAGGLIVLFAVIRGLFSFTQAYMGERVSQSVSFDFRNELFSKIQRLSFSYHDKNRTGQLMIRATDDVEKVRTFIGQGLLMAFSALILMSGTLAILFTTNSKLTKVILPILPLAMLLFMIFGALVRPMFAKVQIKLSTMNSILQENMAGIKVVKAFNREKFRENIFDVASTDYMNQMIGVMRVMTFLMPSIFLLANIGQLAILYYGGGQIIDTTLTLGEYQKFSLYLVFIFIPVGQLGFIITQMAQAAASASRIFEILDAKNEIEDQPNASTLPSIDGNVKFNNVSFRYFGNDDLVLKSISFEANPGDTIALLGMTGSGKSTVINLIPRFYDPSDGEILVDGSDIKTVKVDSLREQIGIVLQETTLFSGTIRDNIAFGKPNATDEEVEKAAKAAAAHEFIMDFPDQYKTPVGERGSTLSGGQKQRIAIARALLLNPKILILDDSTSSVDLQTEFLIQQALDKLMEGRTSFVIAQRISTVLNADQILVLDKGTIAASGNHEELMESSEIYSEIYHSQLMESTTIDADQPDELIAGQEV